MQKIAADLSRLGFSGAAACAIALVAYPGTVRQSGPHANIESRIQPPIHVKAISVAAPAMCWATNDRTGAAATEEAQAEPSAILQICASAAPALRHGEPAREPQSLLAFAP
jgi:hypothetical protein